MANARELPQFLLDRFIKEIEYNPRLKNYLMQKQLSRKGDMVKPGESFVAPVNFAPNKNYEAYKRRVDKYNREARAAKNLPYIFNSGLDPMQGGKGFGKSLVNGFRRFDPSELQEVYTAVRSPEGPFAGYVPYENQATIRLKIPKKDYLKMDRNDTNPELDFDFRNESHVDKYGGPIGLLEDSDKDLTTVQHGGRTDIFQEKIPPKYIDEVYTNEGEWKDPWSFLEEYECDPRVDCDEWYDAISQYLDENGEWDFDKLRKMNKRMGR